ncbi:MAG: ThiF family adenylyltransferase [Kofleriaceae bacterium]
MPRVSVIGAGGLGGPICYALAMAGAEVEVLDDDVVDATNLHRQIAFSLDDVGRGKAEALARRLRGVTAVPRRWRARDADALCGRCDVIIDGSDDPQTKFAVADWASATRRPSVIAGALGHGGNVFLGAPGHACLRCLFEEPPRDAPTCAEAGVLGPAVAQVAALAAWAALELAAGARAHAGEIWVLEDVLRGRAPRRIPVTRRPGCAGCGAPPLRAAPPIA